MDANHWHGRCPACRVDRQAVIATVPTAPACPVCGEALENPTIHPPHPPVREDLGVDVEVDLTPLLGTPGAAAAVGVTVGVISKCAECGEAIEAPDSWTEWRHTFASVPHGHQAAPVCQRCGGEIRFVGMALPPIWEHVESGETWCGEGLPAVLLVATVRS